MHTRRFVTLSSRLVLVLSFLLSSCIAAPDVPSGGSREAPVMPAPTSSPPTPTPAPVGAFTSGRYRNLFKEMLNKSDAEIQAKLDAAWKQLFYGNDDTQRVYYPVGAAIAYVIDIGNDDVRSEGMSYGMMIAVQMDKKEEFDRIWKWARTYMYHKDGPYQGYFAWHCKSSGEQIHGNPASDGEEWFVMALLFASACWGNGAGILDYRVEAQTILDTMLHKDDSKSDWPPTCLTARPSKSSLCPQSAAIRVSPIRRTTCRPTMSYGRAGPTKTTSSGRKRLKPAASFSRRPPTLKRG